MCRAAQWSLPLFTTDPRAVIAAASKYTAPEESDGITLDYLVQAQIDKSGHLHRITRSVTKVLRVQGIESEQRVVATWIPWRENRPNLRIRVITPDSSAHVVDEGAIGESPVSGQDGAKSLIAVLADVEVDSIVEVEIEQSDRESAYPGGRLAEIILDSKFPTMHFQTVVEAPTGQELHLEARGFANTKRSASTKDANQQFILEASNVFADSKARFLPPEVSPRPTITFSNVPNWQAVAQWYAGVFDKSLPHVSTAHPAALNNRVPAIEGVFEEMRKRVRDNSAGLGAVPYTPHLPAEVSGKGTADSKDQALLLITKLNEIGIDAKPALVNSAPGPDLAPGVPGVEAFNRVLVYISGQQPLWIDPAAEFTPVSRIPTIDQGRWALIVDSASTSLVHTPETTADDNRQIHTTEIHLQDGSDPLIRSTIEAFGAFDDSLRPVLQEFASGGKEDQEKLTVQFANLNRTQKITSVDVGEPAKLLKPCRLQINAEGYSAAFVGDEAGFIDLPGPAALGLQRLARLFRTPDADQTSALHQISRTSDYYLPPAFAEEEGYRITAPHGYRIKPPTPMPPISLGPLTVTSSVGSEADGSLSISYRFVNPKNRYTVKEVAAMQSDSAKLAGKGTVRIVLANVAEEKIANGSLKEGISLLRQSTTADATNVNAKLRLASAYVDGGAGVEALRICQELLSRNKESATIYARLGWVYSHDGFGRGFRPGMNMPEAEKAYVKAIELDPSQPSYSLQLAALFTYGPAGIRYGASAQLEQALQVYRRLGLETLARAGALNDYAATLLFARKYDEIRQFFLYPQAESAEPAIKLAAIAATGGASNALEEASYLFPTVNNRRVQLVEAARYLLSSRNYGPAAMLFQAAGAGLRGSLGVDLDALRRTRVMDESTVSKQPAIGALQRFVVATLNPSEPNVWANYLAPEAREIPLNKYRLALLQFDPATRPLIVQPVAWPWLADMLATSTDFIVDGNDEAGFRIRVRDTIAKGESKTFAYVIKRGGEYLVLGLSGTAVSSGEALARIENGDLAGARLWLDWAKEEAGPSKTADPITTPAISVLWPSKSGQTVYIKLAAAAVAARGQRSAEGINAIKEVREQITDPELQIIADEALAQGFLGKGKYAEAVPVLRLLAAKWKNSAATRNALIEALIYSNQFSEAAALIEKLSGEEPDSLALMRLRESLLVQQEKLKEATLLQIRICAHAKASATDWTDLAWLGIFTGDDPKSALEAAEKADQLTQNRNPEVLHTLALAQASSGDLKGALATAYRLVDEGGDSDQTFSLFGYIAEQLDLPSSAASYYLRIKKPDVHGSLSLYSFSQMRLKNLPHPSSSADGVAAKP